MIKSRAIKILLLFFFFFLSCFTSVKMFLKIVSFTFQLRAYHEPGDLYITEQGRYLTQIITKGGKPVI